MEISGETTLAHSRSGGLFAEFSRYVRDNFLQMPEEKQKELLDFIESCVNDDNDLDKAVCTCFLENLSSEPPLSSSLRHFMGPKSLELFVLWDFSDASSE